MQKFGQKPTDKPVLILCIITGKGHYNNNNNAKQIQVQLIPVPPTGH